MAWLNPIQVDGDPWLFSRTGQVPLVVTFAHAGRRRVPGIETAGGGTLREDGGGGGCAFNSSLWDARTHLVAESLFETMDWAGVRPYVVLPTVSRRDCDLNRSWNHNRLGYEAGGVSDSAITLAQSIHDAYYAELARFIAEINNTFTDMPGAPVLVDVHGAGLGDGIDLELGTLRGASAASLVVYGGSGWDLSLHQALLDEGLAVFPDPGDAERLSGCRVLRANGIGGLGADAIQLELDGDMRTLVEAAGTGRMLAWALEAFLRTNAYPIQSESSQLSMDDEIYATLFL